MTIKTLEYIHALLIEDERKRKEVYERARHLQHEYEECEDGDVSDGLIKRQTEAAEKFMREHIAALNALTSRGKSGKGGFDVRKITVLDFCNQIGAASDEIPVVVKAGMQEIGHFRSLYKIPSVAMPGVLEAKINFVTLQRAEIIIQVSLKDFNMKRP